MTRRSCSWFALGVLFCATVAHARRDPVGFIDVQVSVPDAEIAVDGKVLGRSPLAAPLKLMKGTHTIKVTKPGHAEFLDVVKVEVGKTLTIEVDLIPFTAPVDITSRPPGALILVDGKPVGRTPFHGELDPGMRTVRLKLDGYLPAERTIELVAGGDYKVDFPLAVAPPPPDELARRGKRRAIYEKWWFWAGVSALVIGTTAIIITTSSDDPFAGSDRIIVPRF